MDYRTVLDDFVAKNRELRKYELQGKFISNVRMPDLCVGRTQVLKNLHLVEAMARQAY